MRETKASIYKMDKITVQKLHKYELNHFLSVAKILNRCGKDMAEKYGLHHWDNSMIKSCIIVLLCAMKNKIYLVLDGKKKIATFQTKKIGGVLFFEKLAVIPEVSGKGYGSQCLKLIESQAKELGCHQVCMEVYDQSEHAINFYTHKGYTRVGETGTLRYTNLVMEKKL